MDESRLQERYHFFNPWWTRNSVPQALIPEFKRDIFNKLLSYLSLDRIVTIKGPRRTGKSTLFYQLINYLLKEKLGKSSQILYLSFDDPLLRVDLFELLKLYEKITMSSLDQKTTKYIFLDEVQFLPNWASMVKVFFDRRLNIKLFVSGSAASLLIKQSESLAGRTIEETLFPLTFAEWVRFQGENTSVFGNSKEIMFRKYLDKSGFMHILTIDEKEVWTRMLMEDLVTKAIYKDSVEIFGLREPAVLEKLFAYLASSTAGLANIVKLSSMLGVDRIQTGKYLKFLENTLLVFPLSKYSHSVRETVRSQEKIHLTDHGFNQIYPVPTGSQIESMVARHVFEKFGSNTYFWREKNEVDLVIKSKNLLPVEIKNTTSQDVADISGIFTFCREFDQRRGLIIYNGKRDSRKIKGITLEYIPVWEFLMDIPGFIE